MKKKPQRILKFHTGYEGMKMFNNALDFEARVKPALGRIDKLLKEEVITQDESANLKKMMNSPDRESFDLAIFLIETKELHHGNRI